MRTVPDLKELFKQASEIAQQVPPNMQEAAFNRAIDLLTGASGTPADSVNRVKASPIREASSTRAKGGASPSRRSSPDQIEMLLRTIDSTQHPGVASTSNNLDRALMVLKIALEEHEIDGMSPTNIGRVLKEKFRVAVQESAIRMALSRAAALVDRVKGSDGYVYRIMAPGEARLASLGNAGASTKVARRSVVRRATKGPRDSAKSSTNIAPGDGAAKDTKSAKAAGGKKRASNGPGPKAAVLTLHAAGFFDTGKTGADVQQHLKAKRGFTFDPAQLRVALLRLVRDQVLDREENVDGEYEYKRHP